MTHKCSFQEENSQSQDELDLPSWEIIGYVLSTTEAVKLTILVNDDRARTPLVQTEGLRTLLTSSIHSDTVFMLLEKLLRNYNNWALFYQQCVLKPNKNRNIHLFEDILLKHEQGSKISWRYQHTTIISHASAYVQDYLVVPLALSIYLPPPYLTSLQKHATWNSPTEQKLESG